MRRPTRIIVTKLGFAPDMQPAPPVPDDPASVEQLVHDTLRALVNLEHALHRATDRAAATAPVSTEYVHRLRFELSRHTLAWLADWPTAAVTEEPEDNWGN